MTVVIFLGILGILVLVHELGHFLAARAIGVGVEEFGLGFPPRLVGWFKNRHGHWKLLKKKHHHPRHTIFSINLIPLGGFVKLRGEDGVSRPRDHTSFANKTVGERAIIIISGVLMNVVLPMIIFSLGFMIGWPQATEDLDPGARVKNPELMIAEVVPNSPASRAGLEPGDAIIEINGQPARSAAELRQINAAAAGQEVNYKIRRSSEILELSIAAEQLASNNNDYSLGVALVESGLVSYAWPRAIWEGIKLTALSLKDIAVGFWQLFTGLFNGQDISGDVAGPVGIAVLVGQISHLGWIHLLQFIALLSLNLAFINILPFPALDGGRLFFIGLEAITRHPAKAELEALIHSIGFVLLLALVALITIKDIAKLF